MKVNNNAPLYKIYKMRIVN